MKEQILADWIQLINTDGIGPVTFYKMLEKFGSAAEAVKELAAKQAVFSRKDAEYEIEKAEHAGIRIIVRGDELYPDNLYELSDPPPVIYVKGRLDILKYPAAVSIVGSRNASVCGRKIASKIAYDLTENDVMVVSGMARGIDAAAHKGAMYAKNETAPTIAVLGTGADVPYPAENRKLYEQICAQGAVISEFLLGTQPQANNFPRRNRIVSALGTGTLVVEASLNSGSLITARMALEQGKDIFAVPGSPYEGRSTGCNKLIRDGAILTECAEDILDVMKFTLNRQIKNYSTQHRFSAGLSANGSERRAPKPEEYTGNLFAKPLDNNKKNADISNQKTVTGNAGLISLIPANGINLDELIRLSGQSASDVMVQITELELDGTIGRINGSTLILKK